jgi:hypothetical protein
MRSFASYLLLFFLFTLAVAGVSSAQTPTGGVRGQVKDQSDAVVSGATVTARNKGTRAERAITTNSDGVYQIVNLPPGDYELKVAAQGFKTSLAPVTIQVGENVTLEFKLEVGGADETVVITSETPSINTTDYKVDGVVNRKQIDNLPLNGRNFLQLALLEPGVGVESVDNPGSSPNNFFRVSIAGASQALTRISVDGSTINDRITGGTAQNFSQETVQEFQISTFNQDITSSVGSVGSVNVVSRSGGNAFHGTGFIYYRDHNMAAFPGLKRPCDPSLGFRPGCASPDARQGLEDPFFARRQVGGSIGGPIKKDKVFFFYNIENNNQDGVVNVINRNPIFSQFDVLQPQPLNFLQNNIRFDWKATDKQSVFLRFSTDNNNNINSDGNAMPSNWVATKNVSTNGQIGLASVFSQSLINDFRFSYGFYSGRLKIPTPDQCPDPIACIGLATPGLNVDDPTNVSGILLATTGSGFVIGNNINVPQNRVPRTYQFSDTLDWTKGSHRIRAGGEWEHLDAIGSWAFLGPASATLWDPTTILQFVLGTSPVVNGVPNPTLSPFFPLFNSLPDSLKVGTTDGRTFFPLNPGLRPTYAEILQLPLAGFATGIGDPGQPQQFNLDTARQNNRFRFFAGDQWRIHPRFTLNYGVAYVLETNLLNHDFDRPAYLAPLLDGDLRSPRRDKNNFDPSLGFAWDLAGNGKTVIRGGGSILHDSNVFFTRLNERAYTGPSGNGRYIIPGALFDSPALSFTQMASVPTNFRGANLLALLPTLRTTAAGLLGDGTNPAVRGIEVVKTNGIAGFGALFDATNSVTPYTIQVSAGLQREIAPNLTVQADFVMRRGVKFGGLHNNFVIDRNRFNRPRVIGPPAADGTVTFVPDPVIPLCGTAPGLNPRDPAAQCSVGPINVSHGGANSRYTGLHVKVDKRFANRYLFVGSYALSKFTGWNVGSGTNEIISFNDLYASEDYMASDRRHRFTFSGVVDLPGYSGDSRIVKALANTWSVSLISQAVSKPVLTTLINGADLDGDGISTTILPGATFRGFGRNISESELRSLVNQFNTTFPTAVTGLRTARNQVILPIVLPDNFDNGDYFVSQDFRLTRLIRFREEVQLQVIGEVFNLFNVSNLGGYGGTFNQFDAGGQPTFGTPSNRAGGVFGTGGPRAFQLAARFSF